MRRRSRRRMWSGRGSRSRRRGWSRMWSRRGSWSRVWGWRGRRSRSRFRCRCRLRFRSGCRSRFRRRRGLRLRCGCGLRFRRRRRLRFRRWRRRRRRRWRWMRGLFGRRCLHGPRLLRRRRWCWLGARRRCLRFRGRRSAHRFVRLHTRRLSSARGIIRRDADRLLRQRSAQPLLLLHDPAREPARRTDVCLRNLNPGPRQLARIRSAAAISVLEVARVRVPPDVSLARPRHAIAVQVVPIEIAERHERPREVGVGRLRVAVGRQRLPADVPIAHAPIDPRRRPLVSGHPTPTRLARPEPAPVVERDPPPRKVRLPQPAVLRVLPVSVRQVRVEVLAHHLRKRLPDRAVRRDVDPLSIRRQRVEEIRVTGPWLRRLWIARLLRILRLRIVGRWSVRLRFRLCVRDRARGQQARRENCVLHHSFR
jgi:hypothetical protein